MWNQADRERWSGGWRWLAVGVALLVAQGCDGSGNGGSSGSPDAGADQGPLPEDAAAAGPDSDTPADQGAQPEADAGTGADLAPLRCAVDQPEPYLDAPYVGIHGNPGNNERIPCAGPEQQPVAGWQALPGAMIFNPVTVGRDRIYTAVIRSEPEACRLWQIPLATGVGTCLPQDPTVLSFGVLGSSPELDQEGNIYVTDGWQDSPDGVVSFAPDGRLRWRRTFESLRPQATYSPPLGLHFTRHGHVATVTSDGLVVLLSREELPAGQSGILAAYDIPREAGLAPLLGAPLPAIPGVPQYLECRIANILGEGLEFEELLPALTGGTGGSGAYSDNTLAIAGDLLFVVGGGPVGQDGQHADDGALVALKIGGTGAAPTLDLHWYLLTEGGTGSSPTVDPSGRWVMVSDTSAAGRARIVVADLQACEAVVGQQPPRCQPAWTHELEGGALLASLSMDEFGVVYAWNQGTPEQDAQGQPDRELVAVEGPRATCPEPGLPWPCEVHAEPRLLWGTDLSQVQPRPRATTEWSSGVLILDNLVVGTVMHLIAQQVPGLDLPMPIPSWTAHELVGVRRADGQLLWRVPLPDDSINFVVLGPDGHLYVPTFGMFDFMKLPDGGPVDSCATYVEQDFTGGVFQFLRP